MQTESTPLTGDAAWRAAKQEIAKRNDAAYARARAERTAREEAVADRQRIARRKETAELPKQPTPQ